MLGHRNLDNSKGFNGSKLLQRHCAIPRMVLVGLHPQYYGMRLVSPPVPLRLHRSRLLQISERLCRLSLDVRITRVVHHRHGLQMERDWAHLLWILHHERRKHPQRLRAIPMEVWRIHSLVQHHYPDFDGTCMLLRGLLRLHGRGLFMKRCMTYLI